MPAVVDAAVLQSSGYSNDFDTSDSLAAWQPLSGQWSIANGVLRQVDNKLSSRPGGFHHLLLRNSEQMQDVEIQVDARMPPAVTPKQAGERPEQHFGILVRFQDPKNYYVLQAVSGAHERDGLYLYKLQDGVRQYRIGEKTLGVEAGQWFTLTAKVTDNQLLAMLNGKEMFTCLLDDDWPRGSVGLSTRHTAAEFDDFIVKPLGR